jgi:hypothetical protein
MSYEHVLYTVFEDQTGENYSLPFTGDPEDDAVTTIVTETTEIHEAIALVLEADKRRHVAASRKVDGCEITISLDKRALALVVRELKTFGSHDPGYRAWINELVLTTNLRPLLHGRVTS